MSLNNLLNLKPNMDFQAFPSQSAWNEEVSGPLRHFDLIAAQLTSGEHTLRCQLKNKLRKKHNIEDELSSFPLRTKFSCLSANSFSDKALLRDIHLV